MLVSQIILTKNTCVAKPNSDAYRYLLNEKQRTKFIRMFGDVEVVPTNADANTYNVPAFELGRKEYAIVKLKTCRIYGCN